jgi:hypothetical protein
MPMLYRSLAALLLTGACTGLQAQTEGFSGLRVPGADSVWPRWQGRIQVTTATSPWWRPHLSDERDGAGQRLESLSLLGDYFFLQRTPGLSGQDGFRATSGLIFGAATSRALSGMAQASAAGSRNGLAVGSSWSAGAAEPSPATVPYLGLGYTSVSTRSGWGFSADIGLVARSPGSAVKLGRVFSGTQPLDDMLREMRLSPLFNLGVSYSF